MMVSVVRGLERRKVGIRSPMGRILLRLRPGEEALVGESEHAGDGLVLWEVWKEENEGLGARCKECC